MPEFSVNNRMQTARRALALYAIKPEEVTFLQHSENVTFRVDAQDGTYLLRLHTPATPAFGEHGASKAAVNSEMLWLEALQKARFPVPPPLQTITGEYSGDVDGLNVTMLKWLDGEQLTLETESEETAAQIGALVGRLHQQSLHWKPPRGFTRPRRDLSYFENAMLALWPAVEDGRIAAQDYKTLQNSISWLSNEMHNIGQTRPLYGLIHGDLHRGNFLVGDGKIKLIDFSMSAFGHFAYDLGTCLSNVRTAYHSVFMEHYLKYCSMPAKYERLIEAYFLGSYVVTFSLWISDPDSQETLVQRVPLIAQEYAARFNREESYWFSRNM